MVTMLPMVRPGSCKPPDCFAVDGVAPRGSQVIGRRGRRLLLRVSTLPDVAVPPSVSGDVEDDHRWVLRLWLVVLAFAAVTAWRSWQVGIPVRDPAGEVLRTRIAISAGLLLVLVLVDAVRRTPAGCGYRGRCWARCGPGGRGTGRGWCWPGLAPTTRSTSATTTSSWDAYNAPRDALLARVDRWLFLGHSPATLLHHALGRRTPRRTCSWWSTSRSRRWCRWRSSRRWCCRPGSGTATCSSPRWCGCGSWAWGRTTWSPRSARSTRRRGTWPGSARTIVSDTQAQYMAQRAHLLAHPGAHDAFAQVQGFESLHVGVTTVILLMVRYYGLRRATRAMGVFLAGARGRDDLPGLALRRGRRRRRGDRGRRGVARGPPSTRPGAGRAGCAHALHRRRPRLGRPQADRTRRPRRQRPAGARLHRRRTTRSSTS